MIEFLILLEAIYVFGFLVGKYGGGEKKVKAKTSTINLNTLAQIVTSKEGKKVNLSIAQVKEVMAILLDELSKEPLKAAIFLIDRNLKGGEKNDRRRKKGTTRRTQGKK